MLSRTPADIQRSLAQGRCAACDAPVPTAKGRRRTCICAACQQSLAWCSACQTPKPRSAFNRHAGMPQKVEHLCRACKQARRPRKVRLCWRCGEACGPRRGNTQRRLCDSCLIRFAWCWRCQRPRRREDFSRKAVHDGRKHSDECRACGAAHKRTGALQEQREAAQEARRRILAYVKKHPRARTQEICIVLGVTERQIRDAREQYGFRLLRPRKKEPRHAQG
jgi:hypothetical protein